MKKFIAAILILTLALAAASCGALEGMKANLDSINAADKNGGDDGQPFDFDAIMSGDGDDKPLSKMSEKDKQEMIRQGKQLEVDISFGGDGSTTMKFKDGTVYVQNADGSWTFTNENCDIVEMGEKWPDNEYTRLLTKPELGKIVMTIVSNDVFTANFEGKDTAEAKKYVQKIIEKGFTVDPQESNIDGAYSYTASNDSGWSFQLFSADGQHSISLIKPEE